MKPNPFFKSQHTHQTTLNAFGKTIHRKVLALLNLLSYIQWTTNHMPESQFNQLILILTKTFSTQCGVNRIHNETSLTKTNEKRWQRAFWGWGCWLMIIYKLRLSPQWKIFVNRDRFALEKRYSSNKPFWHPVICFANCLFLCHGIWVIVLCCFPPDNTILSGLGAKDGLSNRDWVYTMLENKGHITEC